MSWSVGKNFIYCHYTIRFSAQFFMEICEMVLSEIKERER